MFNGTGITEKYKEKKATIENLKIFNEGIKELVDEPRFAQDIIKILGKSTGIISEEVELCINSVSMPISAQCKLPENFLGVLNLYKNMQEVLKNHKD